MDVFTLAAKLTLDSSEFEKGLNNSESAFSKVGSTIKKVAAALAVGTAIKKTTDAIVTLTKKSVQAYSQYQQLVGGVETLFKKSATTVQKYADQAYKTAGISANKYMETVTSFSASLLQGLNGDTEKAAKIADQAIIDMADNANKMGTTMESLQNAYSGFARNQFTMLDNLHIGYSGSREEMERLLADAEKLTGIKYDINNFADIIEAIHAIQTELGITGTTAEEAEATIQGSFNAVQAAWDNLVVEFAKGNGDIAGRTEILIGTLETAFKNVMPVVENALHGIGEFLVDVAPIIEEKLPELIEEVLPGFIDGTEAIIKGIAAALPSIWGAIVEISGTLMDTISVELHKKSGLLGDVFDALTTSATDAVSTAGGILTVLEDIFGYNDKTASIQAKFGMSDVPLLEQVAGYLDQIFFYNNQNAVFGAVFNDQATGPIKEFLTFIGWVDPSQPEDPKPALLFDLSSKFTDKSTDQITKARNAVELLAWYNKYEVSTGSVHENKTSDPVADALQSIFMIMDWDGDGTVTKSEHDDEASGPIRELLEELGTLFTYNEDGTITWSSHKDESSETIGNILAKLGVLLEESSKNYDSSSSFENGTSQGADEATASLVELSKYKGDVSATESSFKDGTTSLAGPVFELVTALANGPQGLISDTTSRHTVENIVRNIVEGATGQTEAQQQYNQILDAGNGTPTGNALNNLVDAAGSLWNGIVDGVTNLFKPVETHSSHGGKFASAMFGGKILRGATVFGFDDNGPMIGGEAGPEVIVGQDSLIGMIRGTVNLSNQDVIAELRELKEAILDQKTAIYLDTGALVGGIAHEMDAELARLGNWTAGGAA